MPKNNRPRINWSEVELKGDEGRLLSNFFTQLCSVGELNFFALLLSRLSIKEWHDHPTFAVAIDSDPDSKKLRSHRQYFYWHAAPVRVISDLGPQRALLKMKQLLAHEAHHILMMTHSRIIDFMSIHNPERRRLVRMFGNIASDMEINNRLLKHSYWDEEDNKEWDPMPGVYPWSYEMPTDLTMENYLVLFIKEYEQQPKDLLEKLLGTGGKTDPGGDGDNESGGDESGGGSTRPITKEEIAGLSAKQAQTAIDRIMGQEPDPLAGVDIDNLTPAELSSLARDVYLKTQNTVGEAVRSLKSTKSRGIIPGSIQELITAMFRNKPIPWTQVLRSSIRTGCQSHSELSMRRPNLNRRAVQNSAKGLGVNLCLFPGQSPSPTPKVYLIIDTSGSMSNKELNRIYVEIKSIIEEVKAELWVVQCDTQVHAHFECTDWRDLQAVGFMGRGGTTMDEGFKVAKKHHADITICYTDGYVPYPSREVCPPDNSLVWLLTENGCDPSGDIPIGRIIRVNTN